MKNEGSRCPSDILVPAQADVLIPHAIMLILSPMGHDDVIKWKHFPRY